MQVPGKIRGYIIQYTRLSIAGGHYALNVSLQSTATSYEITGVAHSTEYNIQVLAFTLFNGPFSAPVAVSTLKQTIPRK